MDRVWSKMFIYLIRSLTQISDLELIVSAFQAIGLLTLLY